MLGDTLLPFFLPAIKPKRVIAAFDGGRLSSDGGVALLALVEKRVGIIERLSELFPDERDPERVTHPHGGIIGARIFAIGYGYEDGYDLDHLRKDPAFKLACGRLPDGGHDLCSQSTVSRLENAPSLRDVIRLTYALVDQWVASYRQEPTQLSSTSTTALMSFMAVGSYRCSTPIATSAAFCRSPWLALAAGQPERNMDVVRGFAETKHRAGSWKRSRRVVARIEATTLGLYRRYVVTNIKIGTAEWHYDSPYCARGQAENPIKLHKTQLASDRTSCRSPLATERLPTDVGRFIDVVDEVLKYHVFGDVSAGG